MKTAESIQMTNNNTSLTGSLASLQSEELARFDIIKSQDDTRHYRGLKLENGIKVLLISDSTTDKSACCLCTEV